MQWSEIADVVGKTAPIVGCILGSPAGAAVGSLVATTLGTSNTPDAVSAALLADPQAALKLKDLEANSLVHLQQLAITAEQNRLQTAAPAPARGSVRKLIAQPNDWIRPIITVLLLLGAIGIVSCVFFSSTVTNLLKDATASLTIGTVIGYWFNELKQTLAFWFGTTNSAQSTNAEVLNFAVSPGTVTIPSEEDKTPR